MLASKIFVGYNYFTFFFYRFFFLLFSPLLFTLTVTAGLNDPRVAYLEPGGSHFYFYWLRFFISFIYFFCFFCFLCFTFLLSEFTFIFYFSQKILQPLYISFLNYFFSCCFFYLHICYLCEEYHFINLISFSFQYKILDITRYK